MYLFGWFFSMEQIYLSLAWKEVRFSIENLGKYVASLSSRSKIVFLKCIVLEQCKINGVLSIALWIPVEYILQILFEKLLSICGIGEKCVSFNCLFFSFSNSGGELLLSSLWNEDKIWSICS